MVFHKLVTASIAVLLAAAHAAHSCPRYNVQYFSATAAHPAGLNHVVRRYKHALGGESNGNSPGPLPTGQRSINWDAAPLPFDMPFDFFNRVATRGAIFHAKANEFRVSNTNNASDIDDRFSSIIPHSAAKQFRRFSPLRLFTPLLRNRVTVSFRVPAKSAPATVTGFAAVFADVDNAHATSMRFFDRRGCLIARVRVPKKDRGLSFAGIVVKNWRGHTVPVVAKVAIKLGNVSFQRFGKLSHFARRFVDLVAMDDLFYGEPQRIH